MSDIRDASVSELLEVAQDVVDKIVNRSSIFDPVGVQSLPHFDEDGKASRA